MIKAIFFDLDDTLVNSLNAHLKASRLAFERFGYNYDLIEEKVKNMDFMGRRVSDTLTIQRDHSNISEKELPINKLIKAREFFFLRLVKDEAELYPGVANLLNKLKELNKVISIVSSGSKKYIETALEKFNLYQYVDFIITGDDVFKGKPDPECYKKAYEYLNNNYGKFDKKECLVVEDTENGVVAGSKAGLKILLVPSEYSVLPKTIRPDYQLNSLEEFNVAVHLF